MSYSKQVKFTETNRYGRGPEDEDDVYTVGEFRACTKSKSFIDYDGHGHPVRDGKCDPDITIIPSCIEEIPVDATHIVWYNR